MCIIKFINKNSYNLLSEGDLLSTKTVRKVQKEKSASATSEKMTIFIVIKVLFYQVIYRLRIMN